MVAIGLLVATPASACSCVGRTTQEFLDRADAVFTGRVISRESRRVRSCAAATRRCTCSPSRPSTRAPLMSTRACCPRSPAPPAGWSSWATEHSSSSPPGRRISARAVRHVGRRPVRGLPLRRHHPADAGAGGRARPLEPVVPCYGRRDTAARCRRDGFVRLTVRIGSARPGDCGGRRAPHPPVGGHPSPPPSAHLTRRRRSGICSSVASRWPSAAGSPRSSRCCTPSGARPSRES
jgi:hypothetical protein